MKPIGTFFINEKHISVDLDSIIRLPEHERNNKATTKIKALKAKQRKQVRSPSSQKALVPHKVRPRLVQLDEKDTYGLSTVSNGIHDKSGIWSPIESPFQSKSPKLKPSSQSQIQFKKQRRSLGKSEGAFKFPQPKKNNHSDFGGMAHIPSPKETTVKTKTLPQLQNKGYPPSTAEASSYYVDNQTDMAKHFNTVDHLTENHKKQEESAYRSLSNFKRLNQIIDMNDDQVKFSVHNTKMGKVEGGAGFVPGRIDLQQGYDSSQGRNKMGPAALRQQRTDMQRKAINYRSAYKQNAPYHDDNLVESFQPFRAQVLKTSSSFDFPKSVFGHNRRKTEMNIKEYQNYYLSMNTISNGSCQKSHGLDVQERSNVDQGECQSQQWSQTVSQSSTLLNVERLSQSKIFAHHENEILPTTQQITIYPSKTSTAQQFTLNKPSKNAFDFAHKKELFGHNCIDVGQEQSKFGHLRNRSESLQSIGSNSGVKMLDVQQVRNIYGHQMQSKLNKHKFNVVKSMHFRKASIQNQDAQKLSPKLNDSQLLEKDDVRQVWENEFDKQLRDAAFIDEEQLYVGTRLETDQEFRKSTLQRQMAKKKRFVKVNLTENLRLLGTMTEEERAVYELKIREQICQGIEDYLNKGILQPEIVEFNKGLSFDKDEIETQTRLGLFVNKLLSNFDLVSDRIFASYTWELNRSSSVPTDPASYQNIVKNELSLNEKALIKKFVDHLDAKQKEMKEQFRIQSQLPIEKETIDKEQTQEAIDEKNQKPEPNFSHITRGLKPMKKNIIKRRKNQPSEEEQKKLFQANFLQNVAVILRRKRHELFVDIQRKYHTNLLNQFFDISEAIREEQNLEEQISNPTVPIDTIIEQNLEAIMGESTAYENIQILNKNKIQMDQFRRDANEMTEFLKKRTEAKREAQLVSMKKISDASTIQKLFGKKRDALVLKFVQKLKQAVVDRKDENTKKASENFISEMMKKHAFTKALKDMAIPIQKEKTVSQPRNFDSIFQPKNQQRSKATKKLQLQTLEASGGQMIESAMKTAISTTYNSAVEKSKLKNTNHIKSLLSDKIKNIGLKAVHEQRQEMTKKLQGLGRQRDDAPQTKIGSTKGGNGKNENENNTQGQTKPVFEVSAAAQEALREEQLFQDQGPGQSILEKYMNNVLENGGGTPLPILNRIHKGYLPLVNYSFNEANAFSFTQIIQQIIPAHLEKLYLVNNSLKEQNIRDIFESISKTSGLTQLGVIENGLGMQAYISMAEYLIPSKGFQQLRTLVLKDATPLRVAPRSLGKMFESLQQLGPSLKLQKLVLSKLGMNRDSVECLGKAVASMHQLEQLDMSANALNGSHLIAFFNIIMSRNSIKSLNIAHNSGYMKEQTNNAVSFDYVLTQYIRKSITLVHLDITGLGLRFEQTLNIARIGLRKSRTLISVHMNGMRGQKHQQTEFREALKIMSLRSLNPRPDHRLKREHDFDEQFQFARIDQDIVKEVFHAEPEERNDEILGNTIEKVEKKLKKQVKSAIKKPIFHDHAGEQMVIQRILGHPEIPFSHRWVETPSEKCWMCSNLTYTIFAWNKRIAQHQASGKHACDASLLQRLSMERNLYNHSNLEPIDISSSFKNPILSIGNRHYPFLKMSEFADRLDYAMSSTSRNCDSEIENKRFETIKKIVNEKCKCLSCVDLTFWQQRQELNEEYQPMLPPITDLKSARQWSKVINRLLPKGTSQFIDLELFMNQVIESYTDKEGNIEDFSSDTFMCAAFLPSENIDVLIKHRDIQGVNFLRRKQQVYKHMSINKISVQEKRIRKVTEIRKFKFKKSVYKDFVKDNDKIMGKAFEIDKELSKIRRFVKDDMDREMTFSVFKKHFGQIAFQFQCTIANPVSYPVIQWMDFVDICKTWNIVDKNLVSADIDRIFIATNYEEEDIEENDDNSLCRYEFMEIIARMAKTKYKDKGICGTVHESCKKMLTEFIIPNTIAPMEGQSFRDKQLWTLELDDLFKANKSSIKLVYKTFATNGKLFSNTDSMKLGQAANLPLSDQQLVLAYALSKQTLIDEMSEFDKYFQMTMTEFYEYLGRCATLMYVEPIALATKVQRLLNYILPLVNKEFIPPGRDKDIPSESDEDDDVVDLEVQAILAERNCC